MTTFIKWVGRAAFVLSAMVISTGASAQVSWTIAGGKVMGAKNVKVGSSFYDVAFGNNSVFSAVPAFQSQAGWALLASQALVAQVFVTGIQTGDIDFNPTVTNGCFTSPYSSGLCHVFTWDGLASGDMVTGSLAINYPKNGVDATFTGPVGFSKALFAVGSNADASHTYATWAAVTPVPEPETYALMIAGLGLVGAIARRRKSS